MPDAANDPPTSVPQNSDSNIVVADSRNNNLVQVDIAPTTKKFNAGVTSSITPSTSTTPVTSSITPSTSTTPVTSSITPSISTTPAEFEVIHPELRWFDKLERNSQPGCTLFAGIGTVYRALRDLERPIDDNQDSIVSFKGTARENETKTTLHTALDLQDPFVNSRLDIILRRIDESCVLPDKIRSCSDDIPVIANFIVMKSKDFHATVDMADSLPQRKRHADSSTNGDTVTDNQKTNLNPVHGTEEPDGVDPEVLKQVIEAKALEVRAYFDQVVVCKESLYVIAELLKSELYRSLKNVIRNAITMGATCLGNAISERAVEQIQQIEAGESGSFTGSSSTSDAQSSSSPALAGPGFATSQLNAYTDATLNTYIASTDERARMEHRFSAYGDDQRQLLSIEVISRIFLDQKISINGANSNQKVSEYDAQKLASLQRVLEKPTKGGLLLKFLKDHILTRIEDSLRNYTLTADSVNLDHEFDEIKFKDTPHQVTGPSDISTQINTGSNLGPAAATAGSSSSSESEATSSTTQNQVVTQNPAVSSVGQVPSVWNGKLAFGPEKNPLPTNNIEDDGAWHKKGLFSAVGSVWHYWVASISNSCEKAYEALKKEISTPEKTRALSVGVEIMQEFMLDRLSRSQDIRCKLRDFKLVYVLRNRTVLSTTWYEYQTLGKLNFQF